MVNSSTWNSELLNNQFLGIDTEAIEQIPIIDIFHRDTLMWMFEKTGSYTVKSGYTAIQIWKNGSQNSPSSSSENTKLWKKIWNLHTIPRHKTILWRILNNSIPLRSELGKRGVLCSPLCPRCETKIETTDHIFMHCPNISKIWFRSNLNLKILDLPIPSFRDWLMHSILTLKEDTIIQIASITYNIWQARNQSIYEHMYKPEADIIQRSDRCVSDFLQAQLSDTVDNLNHDISYSNAPHQSVARRQWQPPPL